MSLAHIEDAMNLRVFSLVAATGFAVWCLLGRSQALAQNAYMTNEGSNTVPVIVLAQSNAQFCAQVAHAYDTCVKKYEEIARNYLQSISNSYTRRMVERNSFYGSPEAYGAATCSTYSQVMWQSGCPLH